MENFDQAKAIKIFDEEWSRYLELQLNLKQTIFKMMERYKAEAEVIDYRIGKYFIMKNGSQEVKFQCLAVDGEYLFPTKNINGVGYSLLLCNLLSDENNKT